MMKRNHGGICRYILAVLTVLCLTAAGSEAEQVITLSFTGDCTIGSEEKRGHLEESLNAYAEREGYDYFFANFREMFSTDDCTVINLEGVFSDSDRGASSGKDFRLRGPTQLVQILTAGSVEAASLANDHVKDYGNDGLVQTQETLTKAGIGWARATDRFTFEKNGIRICFYAMDYAIATKYRDEIRKEITDLKESGEANAVVILFHNGREFAVKHSDEQEKVGDQYVDCGADLIIMHHPHVVQGIRIRNNRTICYSLGNFVYGGTWTVRTDAMKNGIQATNLHGLVVQARMHFSDSGTYLGQQVMLIPVYTTSSNPQNDYQPRRLTVEEAAPVIGAVQYDSQTELPEMKTDSDGYALVLMPYLDAGATGNMNENSGEPEKPAARPWR